MNDAELAQRLRKAVEELNDAILEAYKAGLRVQVSSVEERIVGDQTYFREIVTAEISRPL